MLPLSSPQERKSANPASPHKIKNLMHPTVHTVHYSLDRHICILCPKQSAASITTQLRLHVLKRTISHERGCSIPERGSKKHSKGLSALGKESRIAPAVARYQDENGRRRGLFPSGILFQWSLEQGSSRKN